MARRRKRDFRNCERRQGPKSAAAADRGNQVICLSALLTTTKPQMMNVVNHLKEQEKDVRIVIGGAVINQSYADAIGADAFGEDAPGAVNAVKRALGLAN